MPPLTVLISTDNPDWPLARQLPRATPIWGETRFIVEGPAERVDAWVVFENLSRSTTVCCRPENTLLVTGEPPAVRRYRQSYLDQFEHVVSCHSGLKGPRLHLQQQGLPWHLGIERGDTQRVTLDWDDLAAQQRPRKPKLLSVICTTKCDTPDHRARRDFVAQLQRHFGPRMDVFGRGYREIPDKRQAIEPYEFHIVLENGAVPHYFSEKLADCLLGWSYPLYYGCPNIHEYFPAAAVHPIDIHRPEEALARIEGRLAKGIGPADLAAMSAARELVLHRYNLFAMLDAFWQAHYASERTRGAGGAAFPLTLHPRRARWKLQSARIGRWARRLARSA